MPDVARSIQRWKARQAAAVCQELAEATLFAVFRPLRFFNSAPSPLWPEIYASISDRLMLGFLDSKDACWDDPRRTASERIKFIGPFRGGDNAKLGNYIEDAFGALGPPDFQGWTNPALCAGRTEILGPNS
ncbi:MAG TPA: hypothetical protein PK867_26285 [Pirellulales bacterium]|nr:hypothetical protein [Pirellulales bacterium]